MRLIFALALTTIFVCTAASPAAAAMPAREHPYGRTIVNVYEAEVSQMIDVYIDAYDKAKAGETVAAMSGFLAALAHPGFEQAPPAVRYEIYHELAWVEAEALAGAAYVHLHLAGKAAPNERDADYWLLMASCTFALRKSGEFLDALVVLAESYPETSDTWDEEWVGPLLAYFEAHAEFSEQKFRLLKALWSMQYRFDDYYDAEWVWRELFQQAVDRGHIDLAGQVAASFKEPESVIWLTVDNRFSAFAPSNALQRVAMASKDELVRAAQMMRDNPRALRPVNIHAWALLHADRAQDALAVLDAAIARFGEAPPGEPAFDDPQYYDWIHNARSVALHALDRPEEALDAQRKAIEIAREQTGDSAYQQMNLGYQYALLGHPHEALAAVNDLAARDLGTQAFLSLAIVQVCAHHALGDVEARDRLLTRMRDRARVDFPTTATAYACAEKADELADLITSFLDDADMRAEVLLYIQTYQHDEGWGPIGKRLLAFERKVTQRPDIKARVQLYGTVSNWRMQSPF